MVALPFGSRCRCVPRFLGDRALTTGELRSELPDVPPASLYRQIGVLVASGVLAVAAEHRVRGAVERTYMLRTAASTISDRELAEMPPEEHRGAFMAYIAGLLGDFDRYLAKGDVDLRRDGVGYRILGMWLDDTEFNELARDLAAVLQPHLANTPRCGRTRRILGTVFLPG
ncbi:MAG: ArsR family transcriptional regulator [Solirubrobacteraceae bacterium]